MSKIPLPEIERNGDRGIHPYPIQIALQTQEFMQGVLWHAAFADIAAGEYVRLPNGVAKIEACMSQRGLEPMVSSEGWKILAKYQSIFGGVVFQTVLILLNSHWDWYVRRLSEFVAFARNFVESPPLSKKRLRDLARADYLPIDQQLSVICEAAGIELRLAVEDIDELVEMTLVRNLGLHNRWEVDARYVGRSNRATAHVGELRLVAADELRQWHALLVQVLNASALACAKRYTAVPDPQS